MLTPPSASTGVVLRERAPSETREGGKLTVEREHLLQARIKDLRLRLSGTPLERYIQQLYGELEAKGISFGPSATSPTSGAARPGCR